MNISGPSIVQAYRQSVSSPKPHPLIVLADSLSHRPRVISPKLGGSANGHNGIKSIISAFGGTHFYRLRLGIGTNKGEGCVDAADYVMAPLSREEREWWASDGLDGVIRGIQQIVVNAGG
jgi:PTH1 family peptidyl-tRNA hydrolase